MSSNHPQEQQAQESDANQSKETVSLNEKIADVVLKVVMTGGVAGGGLGAFWSLFRESDVPKALASAVIGLGISYGASLLDPLHQGNKRRLTKMGEAVDQQIDRTTEQVVAKARGMEDQYFQCQAWDCRRYRSEGVVQHDRIFIPLLEEVFVPLQLDTSPFQAGFRDLKPELAAELIQNSIEGQQIWDLLKRVNQQPVFRQIVILAWGGYGKTTLLKHIAYTYGMNHQDKYNVPRHTPFLLMLRKYREVIAQPGPPNLPELIMQHHLPSLPESEALKLPSDWAKTKLQKGKAVVMFDGFDEVARSQRPAVARWINEQMRCYRDSVFIVTSRPKAYQDQDAADRLELTARLWVKEFNDQQRQDFVERWYLCQERYAYGGEDTPDVRQVAQQAANDLLNQIVARSELKDLSKNPLLLNMIVTLHRRYPGADLPERRVKLYQEICLFQLRDRPSARRIDTSLIQCEAQIILQRLALEMMMQRQERIDREPLLKQLAEYLEEEGEQIEAAEFLAQVVQISELLVERKQEEFEFAHSSFQEYLAAVQIAQQKQESLLYEQLNEDWWKPTILLYVALTKHPTVLIQEAVQRGAIDLAYACLQETTRRVDPTPRKELEALKQTVQTSRYQQLETYLQNQQWKEADQKTYRLMITTVGKEEGQWFDEEDLLNFPCEDLKIIDSLWVKYSNGHFGFSVQKKIYVECNNVLDGKCHQEAWDKFCNKVGWKVDGKYVDLTFNTSCLDGHLPGLSLGNFAPLLNLLIKIKKWWILFCRIESCGL